MKSSKDAEELFMKATLTSDLKKLSKVRLERIIGIFFYKSL